MTEYTPPPKPTQEDWAGLNRVHAYDEYMRLLNCTHGEVTMDNMGEITCSKCGRPIECLSDVQIARLKSEVS